MKRHYRIEDEKEIMFLMYEQSLVLLYCNKNLDADIYTQKLKSK